MSPELTFGFVAFGLVLAAWVQFHNLWSRLKKYEGAEARLAWIDRFAVHRDHVDLFMELLGDAWDAFREKHKGEDLPKQVKHALYATPQPTLYQMDFRFAIARGDLALLGTRGRRRQFNRSRRAAQGFFVWCYMMRRVSNQHFEDFLIDVKKTHKHVLHMLVDLFGPKQGETDLEQMGEQGYMLLNLDNEWHGYATNSE